MSGAVPPNDPRFPGRKAQAPGASGPYTFCMTPRAVLGFVSALALLAAGTPARAESPWSAAAGAVGEAAAARKARAARAPARLCYSPGEILAAVAGQMQVDLKTDIPSPEILMASQTPLKRFQDAVEKQWGMRPDQILNAYAVPTNEIYLLDDPGYYVRLKRAIDDSLAHEFVHFLQVRYKNNPLDKDDDTPEMEAVSIQTWFRETFILSPEGVRRCGPRQVK